MARRRGMFSTGEPYQPIPFDIDCLKILPDEGAMRGRYLQDVLTIKQIKRQLDPSLTSYWISARLRSMLDAGMVVKVQVSGSGKTAHGYQRTTAGRELAQPHTARIVNEEG